MIRGRTTYNALLLLTFFLVPLLNAAQDPHLHGKHGAGATSRDELPIKITINPEARVSVVMTGSLPTPTACGKAVVLPIEIANQGFVTGELEAELVENIPADVTLHFHPAPLTGVAEESRVLQLTMKKTELADLTIAFKLRNETADLAGRDRIHFLLRCLRTP